MANLELEQFSHPAPGDAIIPMLPTAPQITELPSIDLRVSKEKTMQEQLQGVRHCLDYLTDLSVHPEKRTVEITAVVEPILDVFYPGVKTKKGRESETDELIVSGEPSFNLGGGANAVRGLANYAKEVSVITRIGSAWPYDQVMEQQLRALPDNVILTAIKDPHSSDAVKTRYTDKDGNVLKVVNFQPEPIAVEIQEQVISAIASAPHKDNHKVVVSDYGRGMITDPILNALSTHNPTTPLLLDPRPTPSPDQNKKFNVHNAIPTPNRDEAQQLSGVKIEGKTSEEVQQNAKKAGNKILEQYDKLQGILITCDEDGSLYLDRKGNTIHVPAAIDSEWLINPSGAGDIVITTLAVLPDSFPLEDRIRTAMYLAGTSVTEPNTSTLDQALVDKVTSRVRKELAFHDVYERTTKEHNGVFFPEKAAHRIAQIIGDEDKKDQVQRILRRPHSPIYPDVAVLKDVVESPHHTVSLWTQGEVHANNGAGYQVLKVASSRISKEVGGHTWRERAREVGIPRVVGDVDKHSILPEVTQKLRDAGVEHVVVIDDKPDNLQKAKEHVEESGMQGQFYLINRNGHESPNLEGITNIRSFREIDRADFADKRTHWLVDFDGTISDHGRTRIRHGQRIAHFT